MSVITQIASQKWFDQQNNGIDFNSNTGTYRTSFSANTDAKVKVELELDLFTKLELKDFYVTASSFAGANLFANDINVGDLCRIIFPGDTTIDLSINITSVSADIIYFTIASGSLPIVDVTYAEVLMYVITPTPYLRYSFGLTADNQEPSYASVLDGETQTYFSSLIDMTGVATNTMNTTRKNYKTGSATVKFMSNVNSPFADSGTTFQVGQRFKVTHEFIVTTYNEAQLDNILDGSKPDIFIGARTLDYCNKFEFYKDYINNPQNVKISENRLLGSVGWRNENFNKKDSDYEITSVNIIELATSTVQSTLSNRKTFKVTCGISIAGGFSSPPNLVLYHRSFTDSANYENVNRLFSDIFLPEYLVLSASATIYNGTIFKNAKYTLYAGTGATLEFEVQVQNNSNYANVDNKYFTVGVMAGQPSLNYEDGVNLPIISNQYDSTFDLDGLITVDRFEHFTSPNTQLIEDNLDGFTNANLHVEENVYSVLDFSGLNGNTKALSITRKLMCLHNTDSSRDFVIQSENIPINSFYYYPNGQFHVTDYEWKNGFVNDNIFNNNKSHYNQRLDFGWKVPYQSWVELKNADPSFFHSGRSLNGFNKFSANYSKSAFFKVKLVIEFVIDDSHYAGEGHTTTYEVRSEEFKIYGYNENENGTTDYVATRTTFDKFGISIAGNVLSNERTEIRHTFTPLAPPTFSTSVDFTVVSSTWGRFAHGNEFVTGILYRVGNWTNQQANNTDTFRAVSGTYFDKNSASLYTSTPSSILSTGNCFAYYGLYSIDKYETYQLTGKMYSDANDDDGLAFIVAFHVDAFGVEHTISLVATTGGIFMELNPSYVAGSTTVDILYGASPKVTPRWALIYNYGKNGHKILKDDLGADLQYINGSVASGLQWDNALVEDLEFEVIRTSDDIEVNVTWEIDSVVATETFNLNLLSDPDIFKFRGAQNIGFGFNSQNIGGFRDVVLINPNTDFFGINRIEPKNANTDKQIREWSTLEDNATIGWNGTSFVVTSYVEPSELLSDENDISGHLAPKDNEL